MPKKLDIDGYDVVIRVPVRDASDYWGQRAQTPVQAERAASDIRAAVLRHLSHDFGANWEGVRVIRDAKHVCSECGEPWTEVSETYNGGCCIGDEEDHQQAIADNGALGVGA